MMTNREWLSTLSVDELWEWLTSPAVKMTVECKQELTKYGVELGWSSASGRLLQWLKEEKE